MDDYDAAFLEWLGFHGARFPSIEWPSNQTDSGIRGAIAKADIGMGSWSGLGLGLGLGMVLSI